MATAEKLTNLRAKFALSGVSGYVQPVADEYLSEYPPACFQRVTWLCGFTGSAGMLVVLKDKAALFVDGRYTLQAAAEVDKAHIQIFNSGDVTPEQWIAKELKNEKIGYDAGLFTPNMLERMAKAADKSGVAFFAIENPVDKIWNDRPAVPATKVFLHDEKFAGESAASKIERLAKDLAEEKLDAALITAPESVCWLLNIRAHDIECTPLALVRAILYANGKVDLFIDPKRLPVLDKAVTVHLPTMMEKQLGSLSGKKLLCDYAQTPVAFISILEKAGVNIVKGTDPCVLPKARKNPTQIKGIRTAHVRDGAAVAKLLNWLKNHPNISSVSELDIADQLLTFRKENKEFIEPSFPTIAGSGSNGAIVHYRANEKTSRHLKEGELLLIDSGGQYEDGTTDITRTVAIGTPSVEYKDRFTRVLKGHIAIAAATFPKGTAGSALDPLARQYLKEIDLDYDHGTGHGVGQFLGVHEGPQRISKRGGDVPLEVGMVISNEPGYYKTGEYGIRIENLVVVVDKGKNMLGFETLTCVPIDTALVDFSMLTSDEKNWLENYHSLVDAHLTALL